MLTQRVTINQPVEVEGNYTFAEIGDKEPVKAISEAADKYAVAYLNSGPGSVCWGVAEDKSVSGVSLDAAAQTQLREVVGEKVGEIEPLLGEGECSLWLHEVYNIDEKPILNLFVVELAVTTEPGEELYFTGDTKAYTMGRRDIRQLSGPLLQEAVFQRLRQKIDEDDSRLAFDSDFGFGAVLRRAQVVAELIDGAQLLWIDETPGQNICERLTLEVIGLIVDLAENIDEAAWMLSVGEYDGAVSAMASSDLWQEMQQAKYLPGTIFYTGQQFEPAGAFAHTNRPDHLFHYILDVVERARA